MQFVIPQESFAQVLSDTKAAIATRPTHPILANVMLTADAANQTLTVTAFDLNLAIKITVPAQVTIDGAITVTHGLISDIVSRLPNEDISISLDDSDLLTLICGNGKYQINGLAIAEFPALPEIAEETKMGISSTALALGCQSTLISTSSDDTKRILTGVCVSSRPDSIEFAATDGHRVSVRSHDLPENSDRPEVQLIIPAKALAHIIKYCKGKEFELAIAYDAANVLFEVDNTTVISRLLDGAYPNYRLLIPKTTSIQITLERRLFISALERIAVITDQRNNIVKIESNTVAQSIKLSVESPDVAAGMEEIPSQISGDAIEIAFNVKYLLEGLKSIDTNEVQLRLNTPISPALILPIGAAKQTYLLMPVQIRS